MNAVDGVLQFEAAGIRFQSASAGAHATVRTSRPPLAPGVGPGRVVVGPCFEVSSSRAGPARRSALFGRRYLPVRREYAGACILGWENVGGASFHSRSNPQDRYCGATLNGVERNRLDTGRHRAERCEESGRARNRARVGRLGRLRTSRSGHHALSERPDAGVRWRQCCATTPLIRRTTPPTIPVHPAVVRADASAPPLLIWGAPSGYVYAYGTDGRRLWRSEIGGEVFGGVAAGAIRPGGPPDIVVSWEGGVATLDPQRSHCMAPGTRRFPPRTTPALIDLDGDGLLDIVENAEGKVMAWRGADGAPLWEYAIAGRRLTTPAVGALARGGKATHCCG